MLSDIEPDKPLARPAVESLFGATVKDWRRRVGISQEELADRSDLHRTYISDIERGARNVSLRCVGKLAAGLDISVSALFSRLGGSPAAPPLLTTDQVVDILLVEDSAEDAELTLRALKDAHITNRIYIVRDGAAALNFLFAAGEFAHRRPDDHPQLILLDLHLPKIGGLEVLRRIKADPRIRSIPVVVLTSSKHDLDVTASRRLGAETYITKPVGFQNFSEMTLQLSLRWALLKPAVPPPIHF